MISFSFITSNTSLVNSVISIDEILNLFKPSHKNPLDALPWDLLRSIAIIQLYLEERWVEPFEQKKKPFSLLAHQTLSVLMSYGELMPSELAQKVLFLPAFKKADVYVNNKSYASDLNIFYIWNDNSTLSY